LNLLLDTHVALWAIADSRRLSAKARELIEASESSIWISAATVWEIAIKHALGKRGMPLSGKDALLYFRESGYRILSITAEHASAIEALPAIHADPFDRILVAQALTEPMRLMTHDAVVARYDDSIIEV
jgi:PIN domain nuclease of toxin-antitoxin system